jgi:hypothetical protein
MVWVAAESVQRGACPLTHGLDLLGGGTDMLSRPTYAIWLISTILAVFVLLMRYTGVDIPFVSQNFSGQTFEVLLVAYVLLWLGTVVSGL